MAAEAAGSLRGKPMDKQPLAQRQHPRSPVDRPVVFWLVQPGFVLQQASQASGAGSSAGILNISEEGLALATRVGLEKGNLLKLDLDPRRPGKSLALAEVRWIEINLAGEGYLAGLRFQSLFSGRDEQNLRRFLDKAASGRPRPA